jgi:hypothetical protein
MAPPPVTEDVERFKRALGNSFILDKFKTQESYHQSRRSGQKLHGNDQKLCIHHF